MAVDRMSPMDASFLHIEDAVTHMHIGSVSIFEGPPPSYQAMQDMVAGKLYLVPRYRQVVRRVPLDLGRPVWVGDPYFQLEYHLRRTALPRPGGDVELRRLVGRIMAQQLDRSKPLWEMWMVEGLDHDQWAVISKVHHCMVDGVSGTDLLSVILDQTPDAVPGPPSPWHPGPTAGRVGAGGRGRHRHGVQPLRDGPGHARPHPGAAPGRAPAARDRRRDAGDRRRRRRRRPVPASTGRSARTGAGFQPSSTWLTSRRSGAAWVGRSTTSSWPASPAASGISLSPR